MRKRSQGNPGLWAAMVVSQKEEEAPCWARISCGNERHIHYAIQPAATQQLSGGSPRGQMGFWPQELWAVRTCLRAPLTSWTAVLVATRLEESWKTRQPRLDLVGVAFPAPGECGVVGGLQRQS